MKLTLLKLKCINFKSFRDIEIDFNSDVTHITADNGKGKTSVMAAFYWLLTGKDQFDSADVNAIKTYDERNNHIPQLEHSVEGIFLADGREVSIKRLLKEKWVTRRGQTEPVMEGHTTDYFINGVACGTEREFNKEIEKIIPIKIFKLITNPLYFNTVLSWQERREILFQIAPPIEDNEVVSAITTGHNNASIRFLTDILNSGVALERQKKDIAAKKKAKKEELSKIPAMITATERTRPEIPEGGFDKIENEKENLLLQIQAIDRQIADKSKASEAILQKQREKQRKISDLKLALQKAEFESSQHRARERYAIIASISEIENKIKTEERAIATLQEQINENIRSIKSLEDRKEFARSRAPELKAQMDKLIEEFNEVNSSQFTGEVDGICPLLKIACSPLLQSKQEESLKAFNEDKSKKLDDIDARGLLLKQDKEKYEKSLAAFDERIQELENKNLSLVSVQEEHRSAIEDQNKTLHVAKENLAAFDNSASAIEPSHEEKCLFLQIQDAEQNAKEEIETGSEKIDGTLIEEKKTLQIRLDEVNTILSRKAQIEKTDKLVAEYKEQQKLLAQEVATLDGQEDAISEFTRAKISSIESRIAQLFKITRFRLFNTLINGEVVECCDAIDPVGVPVNNTNTAMKTNCGIDIINILSQFYGFSAPIFIDNKESISKIIETPSQVILLEKVIGQNTLKVE